MRTALDSNILSSIWSNEPGALTVVQALRAARSDGVLILSPIAYTELFAYPGATAEFVQGFLTRNAIAVDYNLEDSLWAEAGLRFSLYAQRRRQSGGGQPRRLAADFVIGAHALMHADQLMTLDRRRFERDFPELTIVSPS